jgi:hypothetical protein
MALQALKASKLLTFDGESTRSNDPATLSGPTLVRKNDVALDFLLALVERGQNLDPSRNSECNTAPRGLRRTGGDL